MLEMIPILLASIAGIGAYLIFSSRYITSTTYKYTAIDLSKHVEYFIKKLNIQHQDKRQLAISTGAVFVVGTVIGWIFFGGFLAPILVGFFVATFPYATYKRQQIKRQVKTAEAWPRMIEEIRLMAGSLGRPIPQALLDVGKRGPIEIRSAFAEAEREWQMSTDFQRTIAVLKDRLDDPTADATCETLLIAHSVGGTDIDKRLSALAEDRQSDLHARKDAQAKQAGVRFARLFVLVVPFGMAGAGLSIGNGRAAYETAQGQLGVAFALAVLGICWWWAGTLIKLPKQERVFRA